MAKVKYLKTLWTDDNYKLSTEFCESMDEPYTIEESNYTLTITSDFYNIKFTNEMQKPAFIAGAMIRRDIKLTGLTAPDIDRNNLGYFGFTEDINLAKSDDVIFNIDIKSAYATILLNHGLVTPNTYKYISKLSKQNRLASVGMLASRKEVFTMLGSEIIDKTKIVDPMAHWFYFCVNRTNEIMNECKGILGPDFLMFWVDGIFFKDWRNATKISEVLRRLGYKYSFDICTNFKYHEYDSTRKITYNKSGEIKNLSIPKKNNKIEEFLINFLFSHKY